MQPQLPPHPRRKLANLTLDDLADELGIAMSGSPPHTAAMAEFTRREALAQEATAAAAKETAEATRRSARYMLWSVIVLAVASVLSLGWNLWEHH